MGKEDTLVTPGTGNPTATSAPEPQPTPDPAVELAEARRKNEELAKQVADKDKFISDLATEKSTLEARLQTRDPQPTVPTQVDIDAKAILEKATLDPEGASKDLANLIKNTSETTKKEVLQNLQPMIEESMFIAEQKAKNKDLIDFFGEDFLTIKGFQMIQQGKAKSGKEAVEAIVKEYRTKFDSLKNSNAQPQPTPTGVVSEEGSNVQPPPTPPSKPLTQAEEIANREERRRKMGLV
jgi:hypothetical protein